MSVHFGACNVSCVNKKLSAGTRIRREMEFQIRRSQDKEDKLYELKKTLRKA
jgi:hypothetical protein